MVQPLTPAGMIANVEPTTIPKNKMIHESIRFLEQKRDDFGEGQDAHNQADGQGDE